MIEKSRAEDLFEALREEGHVAVDRLISDQSAEELFLDFKRSADNGAGNRLHNTDRRNLSKAVCGFGNAEGGVILWGVDCSDDGQTGDLPSQKIGIENPARFRASIEGAISGCTVPPHSNVENLVIDANDSSPGLVATLIPKSYQAPLQTVNDLRFLIRAGSSFVPMPHGMVASLFGRPPAPHCFLNFIMTQAEFTAAGGIQLAFGVAVVNDGPGIAEDLYATVTIHSLPGPATAVQFETPDMTNWSGGTAFGRRVSLTSNQGYRLAPEGMAQPVVVRIEFRPPFNDELKIKILGGASGSRPYSKELLASVDEVTSVFESAQNSNAAGQELDLHDVAERLLGQRDDDEK